MNISENIVIPDDKITRYLLVQKTRNDKSKFLAQAGFTLDNPESLKLAIYLLVTVGNAIEDGENEYGTYYQVVGKLSGVNGVTLTVITIWIYRQAQGKYYFVTLKPLK
jgi:hypothetical protein